MKLIDLIKDMYEGKLPSAVSFNMDGDRYTAYLNNKTGRFQIEDWNQDERLISYYYTEVEVLDTPKENKKLSVEINLAFMDKEYLLDEKDVNKKINEIINRHNFLVDKLSDYFNSKGE